MLVARGSAATSARPQRRSTAEVAERRDGHGASERAQLAEGRRSLRERVVLVNRLLRFRLHTHPRRIRHLRISLQETIENFSDDVLDELRIPMRQLNQTALIGPLEQPEGGSR